MRALKNVNKNLPMRLKLNTIFKVRHSTASQYNNKFNVEINELKQQMPAVSFKFCLWLFAKVSSSLQLASTLY